MADDSHTTEGPAAAAESDRPTRAEFLATAGTIGVGAVMAGLIAVPVAGMALTPAIVSEDFPAVKLGDISEFVEGKYVKVVLDPADKSETDGYVRRRVAFVRKNADPASDKLAAPGQGKYTVISNRCAHLGCPVEEAGGTFVCPCHGGAYDTNGNRTAGPPVRPLDRYRWEERGSELWAVGEYSIKVTGDGKGKPVKPHGPGQHTDNAEGWLYPLTPSK